MDTDPARPALADRVPPAAWFVVSGFAQYQGAALAVGLFERMGPLTVGWLRIAVSALFLLAWRRPWRRAWTGREVVIAAVFGVFLTTMNLSFYVAIDHIPLGTAVALEFLGPVGVAAVTGRSWTERVAIGLSALGVTLLAGATLALGPDAMPGLLAIGVAALAWAVYILVGRRVATGGDGMGSLALGMTTGALLWAPVGAPGAGLVLRDGSVALAVLGIAFFSSVVPYALEQVILKRVPAARFAVYLALLPAMATLSGLLVLGQQPTGAELVGIGLVSGAIALTGWRR